MSGINKKLKLITIPDMTDMPDRKEAQNKMRGNVDVYLHWLHQTGGGWAQELSLAMNLTK